MRLAIRTLTSKCLLLGFQLETTKTIAAGKEKKLLREKEGLLMLKEKVVKVRFDSVH